MSTYYVRPDGNNNNDGLSASTTGAWATISKAVTTLTGTHTVYVCPGFYPEMITVPATVTSISFIGNMGASLFSGVTPGEIIVSGSNTIHGEAVRACALNLGGYAGWAFQQFTFLPGTSCTIDNIGSSSYVLHSRITGILNVLSSATTSTLWDGNEYFCCRINNAPSYPYHYNCIFHSAELLNHCGTIKASYINLNRITEGSYSGLSLLGCRVNVYPGTTDGYAIVDNASQAVGTIINGCNIWGVGKLFKNTRQHNTSSFFGNEMHNMDLGMDKGANSTSMYMNRNTFYNCKGCIAATNATYPVTTTYSANNIFIRCDSIAEGYVAFDATGIQAYGGRLTGTGGTTSINLFRLPYESETTGTFTISSVEIPGYIRNLKLRSYSTGISSQFIAWIPVKANVQRIVTLKVKLNATSTAENPVIYLGIAPWTSATVDRNITTVQTINLYLTPTHTGYAPLRTNFTTSSPGGYFLISDITWT